MKFYNDIDLQGNRLLNVANMPNDLLDIKLLHAKDLGTQNPIIPTYTETSAGSGVYVWTDIDSEYQIPKYSALCYAYKTTSGIIVEAVSVSDFLQNAEFKDGLTVNGNGEVSVLIDPTSAKDSDNHDLLTVSANGLKFSGSTLSAEQLAAIAWAIGKRQEDMQEIADSLYVITTTASGSTGATIANDGVTYNADENSSVTMTVNASIKFNDSYVTPTNEADVLAAGWSRVDVGRYSKSLTSGSGNVGAQVFTYTVESGDYAGITVSKSSKQMSISAVYPIFYGFYPTNVATDLATAVGTLTRSVSKYTMTDGVLTNNLNEVAYYWVLTHNSATVTDKMTGNMVDLKTSAATFTSTQNPSITMENYKLYISRSSALANSPLSSAATIVINL